MSSVLQLVKTLAVRPQVFSIQGVVIDLFRDGDVAAWLKLRDQAFSREKLGVRRWNSADFEREFLQKWWWNPRGMWLARTETGKVEAPLLGSVTLAMRGEPGATGAARPVVHWLMVSPNSRRLGIGRALLSRLELAAFEAGYREVWLETHAAWSAAGAFYEAQGYTAC